MPSSILKTNTVCYKWASPTPVWFHAAEGVGLSEELDTNYQHLCQQLLTTCLENNNGHCCSIGQVQASQGATPEEGRKGVGVQTGQQPG